MGMGRWGSPCAAAAPPLVRGAQQRAARWHDTTQFLRRRMALFWTGTPHDTPGNVHNPRNFDAVERAGKLARDAVWASDLEGLAAAVRESYAMQLDEGMAPLPGDPTGTLALPTNSPESVLSWKYCGGGFGGYAVYLCANGEVRDELCKAEGWRAVEPYVLSGV